MTQRFHSIVLAASFALLAGSATAKDHAVSSQPEFDEALAFVRPGDAIVFPNGNWRGVKLNFRAQGEPKKPVTLRAETPGSVVFTGSSELIIVQAGGRAGLDEMIGSVQNSVFRIRQWVLVF